MNYLIIWSGWIACVICAIGWRNTYVKMKSWRYQYIRLNIVHGDLSGVETTEDRWKPEPRIRTD